MTESPQMVAEEVRSSLRDDPGFGVDSLINFANRFALDTALRDESLLLKASYIEETAPDQRAQLKGDMLALVDNVLKNHETASDEDRRKETARNAFLKRHHQRDFDRKTVFECDNLGHTYKSTGFRLHGVGLKLRLGEITGVVGENANGKTTLFRMVVGELRHTEGKLSYPALSADTKQQIDWARVKGQIGYVPQTLGTWYGSLEDNLRYAAAIKGILGKENDREFRYITERMGLGGYLDRKWSELSGGFKLRFELARALIWKPKLLALDEPLANLDFKAQLTILRDIRDLSNSFANPMAVLLSSQHLHEVEAVADNILFLTHGNVVYNGPFSEIGRDRAQNVFEIGCTDNLLDLRDKLKTPGVERIYFNGISFVVVTALEMSGEKLLQRLIDEHVSLNYFRDISTSVKQLFELSGGTR